MELDNLSPMARLLEERRQARAAAVAKTRAERQQEILSALHRKLRLPAGYHLADNETYPASRGEREMIAGELVRAGIIDGAALRDKDLLIEQVLSRLHDRMLERLPPVDWGGHGAREKARDGKLREDC